MPPRLSNRFWTEDPHLARCGADIAIHYHKNWRQADYETAVPLRRWGENQEIANFVVFLASDLAIYITGAYVPVCRDNVMPTT